MVYHLDDGRWWDVEVGAWRDREGRGLAELPSLEELMGNLRTTRVVLAAAYRDNDANTNLAAFCQRCHMIHDRPEHQQPRWCTLFLRCALGDLFRGPDASS